MGPESGAGGGAAAAAAAAAAAVSSMLLWSYDVVMWGPSRMPLRCRAHS